VFNFLTTVRSGVRALARKYRDFILGTATSLADAEGAFYMLIAAISKIYLDISAEKVIFAVDIQVSPL